MNLESKKLFNELFKHPPACTVRAPGRVNLIGEHTDYNDGFVLPMAIDFYTEVSIAPIAEKKVKAASTNFPGEIDEFSLDSPIIPHEKWSWANYVRGVIKVITERSPLPLGFEITISGNVPQGAGLSSSASLEVAVAKAIKEITLNGLSRSELALIGKKAENEFVGCNCGIMDQMISAKGVAGHALLIDCRSLETKPVPLPKDMVAIIVHSNVKRGLVDSHYNERREQCELAAQKCGAPSLRDLNSDHLVRAKEQLDALLYRRMKHVLTENERVFALIDAMANSDYTAIDRIMYESHVSLRDDFEVSHPFVDDLVEIMRREIKNEGGVRMTGGGFGGCVVALVPSAIQARVQQAVLTHYPAKTGLHPTFYTSPAVVGATKVDA